MQKNSFLLAFIAIAAILTIAWTVSLYWGSLSAKDPRAEVSLTQFDKISALGEENCFSMQVQTTYERKTIEPFRVIANNTVVASYDIDLSQAQTITECFSAEVLSPGENFVEVQAGVHRLFYHVALAEEAMEKNPTVSVSFTGNDTAQVKVENNDGLEYAPLEIFVNNELSHRIYFSGESFESNERLSLKEGSNEIRVEFKGVTATTAAEKESGFSMTPKLGISIISALLCVLAFLVFAKQPLLEKIAYSTLGFFAIIIAAFFLLEVLGLLSAINFSVAIALITLALGFLFRSGFKEKDVFEEIDWKQKIKSAFPLLFLIIGILIFSSFFFNLFTASYYSMWTSFYERQSSTITARQEIPLTDQFSFLGTKPFGYISGYFFVNPGVSWLTGLSTQQSYAVIMVLAQTALIASVLLFFRSFGFDKKRSYIALIALFLGGFVFSDFSFNIRHMISYAFLFLSLFFLRKEKSLYSGIALALGTFVQTPVALMFLAALPITLTKKETIKTTVKTLVIAAVVSLLLFSPTLLIHGIPNQAKYNVWGYMWSIPLYGFFLDYLPMIVLIGLFIVPFILLKQAKLDRFSLRVGAFVAIFVFIQLFISYRVNVVATIAFALFAGLLFPKRFWEDRLREYSLAALFAVTFALMFLIIISFYPVVLPAQKSYVFVKQNTSTQANFLNEPTLGHSFIFLAERKSSADLAVEYANEEMIEDSFTFIKTGNESILQKYDIDYVINRSIFLDEKPVGDNLWHETIEFENLDKVYANGFFFVHWVDKK